MKKKGKIALNEILRATVYVLEYVK
jgi:hypothetical protein